MMNGTSLSIHHYAFAGAMDKNDVTLEGIVENGQIRLLNNVHLPEGTKVVVIVPDSQVKSLPRVVSPQLVYPDQAKDFALEVKNNE